MVDRSGQAFEINQYQNIDTSPMESAAACSRANAPVIFNLTTPLLPPALSMN